MSIGTKFIININTIGLVEMAHPVAVSLAIDALHQQTTPINHPLSQLTYYYYYNDNIYHYNKL